MVIASLAFSNQSLARMLSGLDVELNGWYQNYTYATQNDGNALKLAFETSLQHSLPVLPNFKFAQSDVAGGFVKYKKSDFIFYYNALDYDYSMATFDFGFGASHLSGGSLLNQNPDLTWGTSSFSGTLPIVYAGGQINIPSSGFSLFAKASGISFASNTVRDFSAGLKYDISNCHCLVTAELQLGYRLQSFDLADFDNLPLRLDNQAEGIYGGINLDF